MSRRKFAPFERTFIQERAYHHCEYCKFPSVYSHDPFHIEHIVPIRIGGDSEMGNLAWACDGCNTNKWGYGEWLDDETNTTVLLFNPRHDIWQEHFKWSSDFTMIEGLTPTRRATISLLKMNRLGLVNIRKALLAYGVLLCMLRQNSFIKCSLRSFYRAFITSAISSAISPIVYTAVFLATLSASEGL